jgi:hypothetical protein
MSMSHVDEGTLHAYLDGELAPAETQGVEAHLAQCPGCRGRLDEERALIARAHELLASAAPPDRAMPPFRAGDLKPPTRLWWQVRLPLAWAATVVLALGVGMYLSPRGRLAQPATDSAFNLVERAARPASSLSDSLRAQRAEPQTERGARVAPPPAAPAAVAVAKQKQANQADAREAGVRPETTVALRSRDKPAAAELARDKLATPTPAPSPVSGMLGYVGRSPVIKGPALTLDSARALLAASPYAVPDLPVRAIYRGRLIGYSAVVVVEQALDSSTAIDVISGRPTSALVEAVVVSAAVAADTTSLDPGAQALMGRAARVDSMGPAGAPAARKAGAPARARGAVADRAPAGLFLQVQGPLSADSLAALQRRLQPLRP